MELIVLSDDSGSYVFGKKSYTYRAVMPKATQNLS